MRGPARFVSVATAVPLLCAACSAPIRSDPESARPWRSPEFRGPSEVSLRSDAAAVEHGAELRAGARALWRPSADSTLSFAVDVAGIRGSDWWTGIQGSVGWRGRSAVRAWVEAGAGFGAGDGASRAVFAALGAEDRHVGFAIRSVRLQQSEFHEPGDTVAAPEVPSTWDDYTDGEVLGRFLAGGVSLHVLGGLRLSDITGQRPWASAEIAVPLNPRVELRAGGGTRPERPERGERSGSFVRLGVAFRPSAPAPAARPPGPPDFGPLETSAAPGGGWTVAIRIPAARSVEITGDITDWSPLSLVPSPDDPEHWSVRLSADAGVYLVALRIDGGAWRPPPGLPVVPDGFGGRAGLLDLLDR